MIKVKVIYKDLTRVKLKVGDYVKFIIGEESIVDKIAYIGHGVIEGEIYDLTYTKLTKLN